MKNEITTMLKRFLIHIFSRKVVEENKIVWKNIETSKDKIVYFFLSSNPIIAVKNKDKYSYFRECISIDDDKAYIQRKVRLFFEYIACNEFEKIGMNQRIPVNTVFSKADILKFKQYLKQNYSKKNYVTEFKKLVKNFNKNEFSIWNECFKVNEDVLARIGYKLLDKELFDIAVYFVLYLKAILNLRDSYKTVKGQSHSFCNAVRCVSTMIVAKNLGLEKLVCSTEMCRLKIGNEIFYGIISEAAPGNRAREKEVKASPELKRDLVNLHILDVICLQPDHGPNNYNIDYDNFGRASICAFDNDNPRTFFPINSIKFTLAGCVPIVNKNGNIIYKFCDEDLYKRLFDVDTESLVSNLRPYLNFLQCRALLWRINKIKKAMKNSIISGACIPVKKNQLELAEADGFLRADIDGSYLKFLK